MSLIDWNQRVASGRGLLCVILISALAGCGRDETKVYNVPKDSAPPAQPSAPETAPPAMTAPQVPPATAAPLPTLKYQLPAGWKETPPGEMRVASFTVAGSKGQTAEVSVIPLPVVGHDLDLINMWRSRVQLPATSDPNAVNQFEPVAIGAEQGKLFTFVSEKSSEGKGRQRLLEAMLARPGMSWFLKITGDDALVISQKKNFLQFLKSISFVENAPPPSADNGSSPPIWSAPPNWQPVPPAQFLLAEYSIPGADGTKAEVNVAVLNGEGGGLLPNVNRWREQIALDPVTANDLPKFVQPLNISGAKATLVDFSSSNSDEAKRIVAAIVSENGQTWFYKLMGDPKVVTREKSNFITFIQTANYANAR